MSCCLWTCGVVVGTIYIWHAILNKMFYAFNNDKNIYLYMYVYIQ